MSLFGSQKRRRASALGELAPLVSGTVTKGHIYGTYRGLAVEAWADTYDPTPSSVSDGSTSDEVNVFHLRIGGVAGHEPWTCRANPRLMPVADPELKLEYGFGAPLPPWFKQAMQPPGHDPALEERLRSAGVIELVASLGRGRSPFLPHVRYMPALRLSVPDQMRD